MINVPRAFLRTRIYDVFWNYIVINIFAVNKTTNDISDSNFFLSENYMSLRLVDNIFSTRALF